MIRNAILALITVITTAETLPGQAVRVTVDGVCGSGTLCGRTNDVCYVLTNAHVAGTRLGRQVNVDFNDPAALRLQAVVIMAAYDSSAITDWALLRLPNDERITTPTALLSKTNPVERTHVTIGSPRCLWPLRRSTVTTRSVSGGLWRWQPNAIGGQSGSGVFDVRGVSKGLLTWSWGGDGAGQTTAQIWRQMMQRDTTAETRPEGLVEMAETRLPTDEGVFGEVANFPIWDDEDDQEPDADEERQIRGRILERGFNWLALLKAILALLEALDKARSPNAA